MQAAHETVAEHAAPKTKKGDAAQAAVEMVAGEPVVPKAKKAKAVAKLAKDAGAVDPTVRTSQQKGADNVSVEGQRAGRAGKLSAGNLGSAASSGSAPAVPRTVPAAAPRAVPSPDCESSMIGVSNGPSMYIFEATEMHSFALNPFLKL